MNGWVLNCPHCKAWVRVVPRTTPSARRRQIIVEHIEIDHPEKAES